MTTETRPAHSPLGASSAERWMNCPGSVALIKRLNLPQSDEPDFARDGTNAHAMAAWCLEHDRDAWEALGHDKNWTPDMVDAVQVYIDHIRSLHTETSVAHYEHRIQSDRHPLFYGTLDAGIVDGDHLHIRDFKFGAGVVVEVEGNPQILYYAYGLLQHLPAIRTVTLGIVQPRAHHPDGPVRVTETSADVVRTWAETTLFPAMDAVAVSGDLDPGAWCRFCPAKLVCPVLTGLFGAAAKADPARVVDYSDTQLDREYDKLGAVKAYIAAVERMTLARLERGAVMQFAKLVQKKANRVWHENALDELSKTIPMDLLHVTEMKSPAQVEALGPAQKRLVRKLAYTPNTGFTVAHALDSRIAVTPEKAENVFAHVKELK